MSENTPNVTATQQAFLSAAHTYAMAWLAYGMSGGFMSFSKREMIAEWQTLSDDDRKQRWLAACDEIRRFIDANIADTEETLTVETNATS